MSADRPERPELTDLADLTDLTDAGLADLTDLINMADPTDLAESSDPVFEDLFQALTADGTASELAGRPAALSMFRERARRPRRVRFSVSVSGTAVAIVLAGGTAAFAAALPAPVQHAAFRVLGRIGVPDTHRPSASAHVRGPAAPEPAVSNRAVIAPALPATACGCRAGQAAAGPAPELILAAAAAEVPAPANEVLSGRLDLARGPKAGVRVWLQEQTANQPGWREVTSAVTNGSGQVLLTVRQLTASAVFRLEGPGGAVSAPVAISVRPPISLNLATGREPGTDLATVRAVYGDTGDEVVLQARSAGAWSAIGQRSLGPHHQATFSVVIPRAGGVAYRAVLPATAAHGSSVSGELQVAELKAVRVMVTPGKAAQLKAGETKLSEPRATELKATTLKATGPKAARADAAVISRRTGRRASS